MSELKTYFLGKNSGIEFAVYLKSEADKVIAEKDKEIYNITYSRDEWAKTCNQKDKEIAELQKTNSQLASSCVVLNKLIDTREEEVNTLKAIIAQLEDDVAFLKTTHDSCGNCNKCAEGMAKVMDKEIDPMKRQLRHQKYKRCMEMAKWCDERICRIEKDYAFWWHGKAYAQNFYKKWHDRWLAIAEKFKETK